MQSWKSFCSKFNIIASRNRCLRIKPPDYGNTLRLSFVFLSNIDRDTAEKRIINLLRIFYNFTISFIYIFMNFYKRPFDLFSDVNNLQEYSFEYFLLNIQALTTSFFFRINFMKFRVFK